MIDTRKTVISTAYALKRSIATNIKRRDIDTSYIIALSELGKIREYMINNFYEESDINLISRKINELVKSCSYLDIFTMPDSYLFSGYKLTTEDEFDIITEDSFILKL